MPSGRRDENDVRSYPINVSIGGISGGISALDATGQITKVYIVNESDTPIIKQGVGGVVKFAVDYNVTFPGAGFSWRVTTTVCEAGSIPIASAWKNYRIDNASLNAGGMSKTFNKLDMNGNIAGIGLVMPNRTLNVVIKLFVRGDQNELYPVVSESWRD